MSESSTPATVDVAMIAAESLNHVIGLNGKLPWYLPEDLRFFKRVTSHKPVVMGRATFESIGKPLPNRTNIVISRNPDFHRDGVKVADSIEAALAIATAQAALDEEDEVMVIGGGEIYRQALPLAQRIYLTQVDVTIEGDTWFPALSSSEWVVDEEVAGAPEPHQPAYRFLRYERVTA